jgi:Enterobacter phage Enc34, ssDNA-binding protein
MTAKNPKTVTIYGRLSFPNFQYQAAVARNQKSQFPKAPEDVAPDFNLLVEQPQLDKLIKHVTDEFLPYCLAQSASNEKRDALTQAEIGKIMKIINASDWDSQPPYVPIKPVNEKTATLAPEAVASVKVMGNRGTDIELKAIVNNEDELLVPDPDLLQYPVIKPIGQTVHQMYGGCYVAATLNLYAFISGKLPGFSASASVAVFKADGERFGGGVSVDEDEIFAD